MSRITTQASHPRRAVADAPRNDTFGSARDSLRDRFQQPEAETARYAEIAAAAEVNDNRHTLNSSLAALTVSALGLAVAGAVTMTSNAQAANPQAVLEAQQKSVASATIAEPAPARPASPAGPATSTNVANTTEQTAETGALEGRTSDNTSRTAARTELDAAMGAQLATERSKQLAAASDSAADASREAALASRSDRLAKAKQATEAAATEAAAKAAAPAAPPLGTLNVTAAKSATQSIASTGGAASPMKPGTFSLGARFGAVGSWSRYHTGADLPAPVGTPIFAAASGVIGSPNGGGWAGNHVVIQHSDGGATLYAHMSSTSVGVGQQVSAGQLIGYVGMTGRTFGPHLHWEYYPSASTVGNPYTTANPVAWLAARGVSI